MLDMVVAKTPLSVLDSFVLCSMFAIIILYFDEKGTAAFQEKLRHCKGYCVAEKGDADTLFQLLWFVLGDVRTELVQHTTDQEVGAPSMFLW